MSLSDAKIARIRTLHRRKFSVWDIAGLQNVTRDEVRRVLDTREDLRQTYQRLMAKIPFWWKRDAHSYRLCVIANFSDVLGPLR